MGLDQTEFFARYGIAKRDFSRLPITWDELRRIHEDYLGRLPVLAQEARGLAERMNAEKSIHSIKYRVKDAEHVLEKILRKMKQYPGLAVTRGNYREVVLDLIGLRALVLFKERWADVHRYLAGNWEFSTPPKASYKKGDPASILGQYSDMGCELNEHPHGYRSVHYHLVLPGAQGRDIAEVQVRTLFEEAWSEIDHHFRYSQNKQNDLAEPYMGVLNNITSNADALASYINRVKTDPEGVAAETAADAAAGGQGARHKVRDLYRNARESQS